MNKIDKLFQDKKEDILSVYFTAGFPGKDDTMNVIRTLNDSGTDLIEIGMPFSDPVADGPVIQGSNDIALKNGMTIELLFNQLKSCKDISIPKILMGYINPVLQFGIEEFCKKCNKVGVDGVILPDLPFNEYQENYKDIFDKYGINNILLVTPQTSDERLKQICDASQGFVYVVSTSSTTGLKGEFNEQEEYFKRIKSVANGKPTLIGFGIHDNKTFETACRNASGGIIGSAFIKAIKNEGSLETSIEEFIKSIRN